MDTTVKQEPAISCLTKQLIQYRIFDYLLSHTTKTVADEHLLWVARSLCLNIRRDKTLNPNLQIVVNIERTHHIYLMTLHQLKLQCLGPPSLLHQEYPSSFPGEKSSRDVKLTTHFHLVLRLRMSGATTLLPFHVFMAWTGKSLTFTDFGYY